MVIQTPELSIKSQNVLEDLELLMFMQYQDYFQSHFKVVYFL